MQHIQVITGYHKHRLIRTENSNNIKIVKEKCLNSLKVPVRNMLVGRSISVFLCKTKVNNVYLPLR